MLKTENEDYGFYGECKQHCGTLFADEAWEAAFKHIEDTMLWEDKMPRDFLDSKHGRYYAERMWGHADWKPRLTRDSGPERNCRDFWQATDKDGYALWCRFNGRTPTQRAMEGVSISRQDIHAAVQNILALDYSEAQITAMMQAAGPLASAFALLLAEQSDLQEARPPAARFFAIAYFPYILILIRLDIIQ